MPNGTKSYKVGDEVYDIPNDKFQSFLKEYPTAREVNSFQIGGNVVDVPVYNVNDFLKTNPNAKPFVPQQPTNDGMLNINDTRSADNITGKPILGNNKLSVNASTEVMKRIIAAAKAKNVDPYTALAIAHQETGLAAGGDTEWNPFHLLDNRADDLVSDGIRQLNDKMAYAKKIGKTNEADVLQAFNGYGKVGVGTEGYGKKFYGINVTQPIDMNKNPVYGKRIIDIRDNILKKNKDVINLVNSTPKLDEFEQYKVR